MKIKKKKILIIWDHHYKIIYKSKIAIMKRLFKEEFHKG